MKHSSQHLRSAVILLTLLLFCCLNGCAHTRYFDHMNPCSDDGCAIGRYMDHLTQDTCKSRAYVQLVLEDYITRRYYRQSPVRLAIIPFSVPANLAALNNEKPGLGNQLAWQLQANLLGSQQVPIVEVFNRQDWPGKKEEFFTGNFGALALAKEAGYDLVLVGYFNDPKQQGQFSATAKLIEVESGITVWYGKSDIETFDPNFKHQGAWWWWTKKRPDLLQTEPLTNELASCLAGNMLSTEPTY